MACKTDKIPWGMACFGYSLLDLCRSPEIRGAITSEKSYVVLKVMEYSLRLQEAPILKIHEVSNIAHCSTAADIIRSSSRIYKLTLQACYAAFSQFMQGFRTRHGPMENNRGN